MFIFYLILYYILVLINNSINNLKGYFIFEFFYLE